MTVCCAGGVLRLSSQVLFFEIPTPDLCALHAFAPLASSSAINHRLAHWLAFVFIFFLSPFFCAKQKQVYRLLRERQQRGMCRDYQSVIFLLFLSSSPVFLSIVSRPLPNLLGLTRPVLDSRLSIGKAPDRRADNAEGYAPPEWEWEREREQNFAI